MSTSTSLVFLYELLNCFSHDLNIHSEKLCNSFLNQQKSYNALLNLICEYIFLIERLQRRGNIFIERHHKSIKSCDDYIKQIFVELFLFKFSFPISMLNKKMLSTSYGLVIALGWVLEKSNILTILSKYLLQFRTGEIFLQFDNNVLFDTINLYPSVQNNHLTLPSKSLDISKLLIPIKSEYFRIICLLRELRFTIELNVNSEQQVRNVENCQKLIGLIKEYGLVDLHYLQSKHLANHFINSTRNQICAINSLKSAFSNVHQFWYVFDSANKNYKVILENIGGTLQQPIPVPPSFQRNQGCFIRQVISSVIVVVSLSSNDQCNFNKEQLRFFKLECEKKLNGYFQCLSSICGQFNSKTKGLLTFYNF